LSSESKEDIRKKILVVDDQFLVREGLKDLLYFNGYNVIAEASDGKEAISKYKETSPDLVIMDIDMPEVNGFHALQGILKIDPKAQVIMLSGQADSENIKTAIKVGAKSFLVKPFDRKMVISKIQELLNPVNK